MTSGASNMNGVFRDTSAADGRNLNVLPLFPRAISAVSNACRTPGGGNAYAPTKRTPVGQSNPKCRRFWRRG
jgi:hypothetical protein